MKNHLQPLFPILMTLVLCSCGQEYEIRKVCNNFIAARKELRAGNPEPLKQFTEDSLYELSRLNQAYVDLIDAPVIEADLNIQANTVEQQGDCWICNMTGMEFYQVQVCQQDERWVIVSENGYEATTVKISEARKKLKDQIKFIEEKPRRDSVYRTINEFFGAVKIYFQTGETSHFGASCNAATLAILSDIKRAILTSPLRDIIEEEMGSTDFSTYDTDMRTDSLVIGFPYQEPENQMTMRLTSGQYQVIGLLGYDSDEISTILVEERLISFLRALKLIRAERWRLDELKLNSDDPG
ncbi:MAG: hypothetical protein AAF544_00070 [Bacteroidota bacterium]